MLLKLIKFFRYKYKYYFIDRIRKQISYKKKNGLTQAIYKGQNAYLNYLDHQKFKFNFQKKDLAKVFDTNVEYMLNNFQIIKSNYPKKNMYYV